MAFWSLTVAAGNVVVILVAESAVVPMYIEYFIFVGLIVCAWMLHEFWSSRKFRNFQS